MAVSLTRFRLAVLCSASAVGVAVAQPVSSGAAPNTSRVAPAPATGATIPAGQNMGTPATGSLPLGTPAAPDVLAPAGGTAAARAAARQPPATSQNPISRSRTPERGNATEVGPGGRAATRPQDAGSAARHPGLSLRKP